MKLTKQKLNQLIRETTLRGWPEPPEREEEEDPILQLKLDWDEFDLIARALTGRSKTMYDPSLDATLARGARSRIINAWEDAEGPEDPIPVTKSDLETIKWVLTDPDLPRELKSGWRGSTIEKVEAALTTVPKPKRRSQMGDDDIDPRFAHLEFDENLKRYKEGKNTMKLTKNTLHQLIREEINKIKEADGPWGPPFVEPHPRDAVPIKDPVETEPEEIPIEDITFNQLRGKQVTMADSGGMGGDSSVLMSSEPRFEEWKSTVLRDYPGSTIIFNRWGRWSPGSGPWKDEATKKQNYKAKQMARWGSH